LETKNLSVTEKTAVTSDEKDIKGQLLEYHVKMELQGYRHSTIRLSQSALRTLIARGAALTNPETVKQVIANQSKLETAFNSKIWSGNRKRNVINAYTAFLEYLGLSWKAPIYEIIRKLPFIPTEQEIDDVIAGSPNTLATFLQLLKETGMRRGEAIAVPWKDVDLERRIVMCNAPEKGSNARIFSDLSGKLLNMLSNLPRESDLLFGDASMNSLKNQLCRTRNKLAFKLGNPRLKAIHMHTLRYWKGTMLYHYKPDILFVAEFLGHKCIENTRLYIQLEKNLFKNLPNDQFITRIAVNAEQACQLIEVGFEYITGEYNDGGKIFRKRK
jgi:integrase